VGVNTRLWVERKGERKGHVNKMFIYLMMARLEQVMD